MGSGDYGFWGRPALRHPWRPSGAGCLELGRVLINRDCSAIAGCRKRRVRIAPDAQATFCRRAVTVEAVTIPVVTSMVIVPVRAQELQVNPGEIKNNGAG